MADREVYYSFRDMPFTENHSYGSSYSGSAKMSFSKKEIFHLLIAMGVLTIAFAFALAPFPPLSHVDSVLFNLPLAFLAIATAFVCHELAHKYMGQKYGYRSEFRMYKMGLLLALFLGVATGIVFAAPGAVRIFGNPNHEESGKLATAGPLTNIVIALMALGVMLISVGFVREIAFFVLFINAFLAFFNLLPFGPLDGRKVFRWNKIVWIVLIAISVTLWMKPF
ncbi:MAG: site-2 protease family protein [Candidatus Thermoplasmatota archaeon]